MTDFVVDGFSAHVTARVTNPGNGDAHNVQAQVRVTSAGSIVQVNDADSYTLSIGTLRSQQAVTVNTTLTFNILDTLEISSQGATVYLWLISDEKTRRSATTTIPEKERKSSPRAALAGRRLPFQTSR